MKSNNLSIRNVQREMEKHYLKTSEAFEYDPNNPLFRYRITLYNNTSFEVIMTNRERSFISQTSYWPFIKRISGLGTVIQ